MVGPLIDPESRWLEEPSADDTHRRIITGAVLITPNVDITLLSVIRSLQTIAMERRKGKVTMVGRTVT